METYKIYITTTNGKYLYYMNTLTEIANRLQSIESNPDIWGELKKVIINRQPKKAD